MFKFFDQPEKKKKKPKKSTKDEAKSVEKTEKDGGVSTGNTALAAPVSAWKSQIVDNDEWENMDDEEKEIDIQVIPLALVNINEKGETNGTDSKDKDAKETDDESAAANKPAWGSRKTDEELPEEQAEPEVEAPPPSEEPPKRGAFMPKHLRGGIGGVSLGGVLKAKPKLDSAEEFPDLAAMADHKAAEAVEKAQAKQEAAILADTSQGIWQPSRASQSAASNSMRASNISANDTLANAFNKVPSLGNGAGGGVRPSYSSSATPSKPPTIGLKLNPEQLAAAKARKEAQEKELEASARAAFARAEQMQRGQPPASAVTASPVSNAFRRGTRAAEDSQSGAPAPAAAPRMWTRGSRAAGAPQTESYGSSSVYRPSPSAFHREPAKTQQDVQFQHQNRFAALEELN